MTTETKEKAWYVAFTVDDPAWYAEHRDLYLDKVRDAFRRAGVGEDGIARMDVPEPVWTLRTLPTGEEDWAWLVLCKAVA